MDKKKILYFCIIFLLFFHLVPAVQSPEDSQGGEEKKKSSFFKNLFEDEWQILTSPFRIKGKSLLTWGSAALITAVLIHNDEEMYRGAKNYQEKNEWVSDLSPKLRPLGNGTINLGVAGCFYICGVIFKDKKARKTAELSLMSLVHAGVVVQLLKHLTGRKRPEAAPVGEDHWEGPAGFFKRYKDHRDMYYDAFPSGHTITAWSIATVIAKMYNKSVVVPALCYSLATMAGLSNVTEDKHWFSDVFAGAALGYAIGNFVVKTRWRNISILPFAQHGKVGLSLNYSFN
ncbi:MAG: phosphatase PAP2 family protein [Candidatus Aminicenantes bacterium]|nr:phosphatase PAP2 family protein [Candidatus Aminicenantes bacterium]